MIQIDEDLRSRPMRIIVCGSRRLDNVNLFETNAHQLVSIFLASINAESTIITGGAIGVDSIAFSIANYLGMPTEVYEADFKKWGKAIAGRYRNRQMLDSGVDFVMAFWDGKSSGTRDMLSKAEAAGVPFAAKPITRFLL